MIKKKKYAAIDIGLNAMRLLIVNIVEQEGKDSLIKVRWYVFPFVWVKMLYSW
jgi:exopolyphosphatase/pppGpp-phosphohydrolase